MNRAESLREPGSARLTSLWRRIEADPHCPHSSVIVPSLSMDERELAKIPGVPFYEERLLFLVMRLRNPAARVLYVTSQPLPAEVVEYYLDLLPGVPAAHARARLHLLCTYDARPLPLTKKILERPRLIRRMRAWIGDTEQAYMTCFNSSPLETALAGELGIPLNGVDPALLELGTKSGSRKVFREAGVDFPEGFEDVRSRSAVVERLAELGRLEPAPRRAVVKLDESFSGEGNAIFTYPEERTSHAALDAALEELRLTSATETVAGFLAKFEEQGGIVERFVEADEVRSPSVQMRITPVGAIEVVSTHEQILGGSTGQAYAGCSFPAREEYRSQLVDDALRIAEVLKRHGVVSRFAIDFVTWRAGRTDTWRTAAIELNLRMGGTTFPFLALEFLTRGKLDDVGRFVSARGTPKYYVATDSLGSPNYRGLLPEDLTDLMVQEQLGFDPGTESGVLFHMIGALSQYGKLGVIAIGDSPEEARRNFDRTKATLDRETGLRDAWPASSVPDLPRPAVRID